MAHSKFECIKALEENSSDVYLESTEVLIRIARNVITQPSNPKYRSISLGSNAVKNKLLCASGAMECLFEMGFQEGDDKLIFPQGTPLDTIKQIHDELIKNREKHLASKKVIKPVQKAIKLQENPIVSLVVKDLTALSNQTTDSFFKKIFFWCFYVFKYENSKLQLKALKLIPITKLNLNVMRNIRKIQLEFKQKKIKEEVIDYQELLLMELCNWFNTEFFTWVDTPQCNKCGFIETTHQGLSDEKFSGADRVEKYHCQKCNETVLFPRYNDPDILLETRKGRCGEWANCFCLFARSLGWDARLVFDETDHVWIEVYSVTNSRWVHCDPCENAVDTPLMYECGWKKKLSYIIAYSKDEIQDVTWRYSCMHSEILKNRNKCSEEDLVNFIVQVRNVLLARVSEARRNYVIKRTALELVDLMKQKSVKETEEKGRISGSLVWRLLRKEISNEADFKPYIWKVDEDDEKRRKFVLSYSTSKDEYYKHSKIAFKTWKNGLFSLKSVFKKVENDWKMSYLSRTEGAERGILSWKFDAGDKFSIGTIEVKLACKTFETGMISSKLCSDESCVLVPTDKNSFVTDAFMGLKTVELMVEMFGGSGSESWQHSQILRQSLNSEEKTLVITISLVQL